MYAYMFGFSTTDAASNLPDEEVLFRACKEPWLFAVLLDRYQDPFLRKARGILRNEQDAEEVVQDAFTKIYQHADRFVPQAGASFSSWAYKILMNTAFTRYQQCVRNGQRMASLDPEFEQMLGERKHHVGFADERDAIDRVLARLPGHFARVLQLHYLERWSHKDIADETGETVGTVKTRIHRAKAAFKKEAADGEVELFFK